MERPNAWKKYDEQTLLAVEEAAKNYKAYLDAGKTERECAAEAIRLAKQAETVVLALGEHRECTGEAASRGELTLPKCQLRLLDEVSRVNPNVAVLLFMAGALVTLEKTAKGALKVFSSMSLPSCCAT